MGSTGTVSNTSLQYSQRRVEVVRRVVADDRLGVLGGLLSKAHDQFRGCLCLYVGLTSTRDSALTIVYRCTCPQSKQTGSGEWYVYLSTPTTPVSARHTSHRRTAPPSPPSRTPLTPYPVGASGPANTPDLRSYRQPTRNLRADPFRKSHPRLPT